MAKLFIDLHRDLNDGNGERLYRHWPVPRQGNDLMCSLDNCPCPLCGRGILSGRTATRRRCCSYCGEEFLGTGTQADPYVLSCVPLEY